MHKTTERLYTTLKELNLIPGRHPQAEVARGLNISSQIVYNWETRGISKAGLLECQKQFGVSATWLEFGTIPDDVQDGLLAKWEHGSPCIMLSPIEKTLLEAFAKLKNNKVKSQAIGYVEWLAEFSSPK